MTTTAIQIENLKCGGCAATIKKGILTVENVKEVTVNVDKSLVIITYTVADLDTIKEKLAKLGYPEAGHKNTIVHKAKSFVSCAIGRMDG